jgi:hypothetical protein
VNSSKQLNVVVGGGKMMATEKCVHIKQIKIQIYPSLDLKVSVTQYEDKIITKWDCLPIDALICLSCGDIQLKMPKEKLKILQDEIKNGKHT